MHGFIVVNAETGRALRSRHAAVPASAVLDCAGGFRAGDTVHVVVRGRDGGQGVIATGVIACDASRLARSARGSAEQGGAGGADKVVMREQDIELLWQRGH